MISQADFLAAGALQLLLKLKRHLKIVYGLDDIRCQVINTFFRFLFGSKLLIWLSVIRHFLLMNRSNQAKVYYGKIFHSISAMLTLTPPTPMKTSYGDIR